MGGLLRTFDRIGIRRGLGARKNVPANLANGIAMLIDGWRLEPNGASNTGWHAGYRRSVRVSQRLQDGIDDPVRNAGGGEPIAPYGRRLFADPA